MKAYDGTLDLFEPPPTRRRGNRGFLTPESVRLVEELAAAWRDDYENNDRGNGHGNPTRDYVVRDLGGARGEIAYAQHFDEPRPRAGVWGKSDFRGNIQVRGTGHENGRLIIYEADFLDQTFVLVTSTFTGAGWEYVIVGEINGRVGWANSFHPGSMIKPDSAPQRWVEQYHLRPHRDAFPLP